MVVHPRRPAPFDKLKMLDFGPKKQGITVRAIVIGLLLIPINSYWIFMCEIIRYQGHPTTISLFYSSIFNLVLLILLNGLLRRFKPAWLFSQSELITIYIMLNIGAALVGHDSIQILVSLMPYAKHVTMVNPDAKWGPLFADGLPDWLVVKDPIAVKNFYAGGQSILSPENLHAWIVPVMWWSAFIVVLGSMFLCMNVLLRKQWTEREKLSYPLVQLPLDMTVEGAPLFKEKLLWIGFGIAAAIDIINGLNVLYPGIPGIAISKPPDMLFNTAPRPWNAIGSLPIRFYPFGIGLGMLLPVDLLFSCWFFYWFWKAETVVTAWLGYDSIPRMPFVNEQSFGAYMGICVFALMVSRKHFIDLVKHFIGRKTDMDDADEPIRYKSAMWFILFGAAFLTIFSRAAGLSPWLIPPFFLIFFAMSVAVTRMRAELGPPAHDLHNGGPDRIITSLLGPREIGTPSQSVFSMFFWFNRAYRSHQMPFQLEGFKMAERTGTSYRGIFIAIMIAMVFGTFVAFSMILHLLYQRGAASATLGPPNVPMIFGSEPWNRMEGWVKAPAAPDTDMAVAIVVGFATTILLNSLRMKMGWFPFHPVGFAVSSSWSMNQLWLPMLIAWIVKLMLLRYGGLKLYRRALPFFLGIILGECVLGSFWTIWGITFGRPSYAFWP